MDREISTPKGIFILSDDQARLDLKVIHGYLTRSYWSADIPFETVQAAIQNSYCIGLYAPDETQAGFARLVTDQATIAHLLDVFILEDWQGLGLGKALVAFIMDLPFVAGLRRLSLNTRDAHDLYKAFGFAPLGTPEMSMEILRYDMYQQIKQKPRS